MPDYSFDSIIAELDNPQVRKHYFRNDFPAFYAWHSKNEIQPFQNQWLEDLETDRNFMIVWFRGSAKTTIVRWYVVWCIVYKIEPYIVVQSFEDKLSSEWVREIAKMLMTPSLMRDYWILFPFGGKREDLAKSSMSSFETTNGIKIESKSLGQTLRWANTTQKDWGSTRPTLLILDDIDVDKSVKNIDIIDDNERKIIGETIGALDPAHNRIIFLGNVINVDWIVPRFKNRYKDSWLMRECWLYDGENGSCIWEERFTEEVIAELKLSWEIAFGQNYLGIPYADWMTIIKRSSIRYEKEWDKSARVVFGIDPAFSEKTNTDSMALTISAHKWNTRYVIQSIEFNGSEKDEERFVSVVHRLYLEYKCACINIEANNGGEIIWRMLKKKGMAVNVVKAIKDKITRLREYEWAFERGEIFFLPGNEKVIEQLLLFPNAPHDDLVDSMVYSLDAGVSVYIGIV